MRPETLRKLAALEAQLGMTSPQIVATLLDELARAIADLGAAVKAGDFEAAYLAAHAARNSALMLDARSLLSALGELETAARRGDPAGLGGGLLAVQASWVELRSELEVGHQQGPAGPN